MLLTPVRSWESATDLVRIIKETFILASTSHFSAAGKLRSLPDDFAAELENNKGPRRSNREGR
jgi:hypothetical protein